MAQYRLPVHAAQYISQYDPAMEQMQMQVMKDRSNRFEQSYANISDAQAKLGEIFFLDQNTGQQVKDRFAAEKEDILNRYNYDYEAAAPELNKLVIKERNDPVYQMNQYAQKRIENYQNDLSKIGPENALVINDPTKDLSLYKNGRLKTPEDYNYKIFDKSQIDKKLVGWLGQLKPEERSLELDKASGGQYWKSVKEITKNQFNEILTDDKMEMFLNEAPEIRELAKSQGYEGKEKEFARQMLIARGEGIVGIPEITYMANQAYGKTYTTPESIFDGLNTLDNLTRIRTTSLIPDEQSSYTLDGKIKPTKFKSGINRFIAGAAESFGLTSDEYNKELEKIESNARKEYDNLGTDEKKKISKADYVTKAIQDFRTSQEMLFESKENESFNNFLNRHGDELNGLSTEMAAKSYNNLQKFYSAEFSKFTFSTDKFNIKKSDEVFVNTEGGQTRFGNLTNRNFVVYSGDGNSINPIGTNRWEDLAEFMGNKKANADELLKDVKIQGIDLTSPNFPGAYMANTVKNQKDYVFEVEGSKELQQNASTIWGVAAALRDDNDDISVLTTIGNDFGITKDDEGNYKIPNTIEFYKKYGISYFKAKNIMIDGIPNPVITAYDKSNEPIMTEIKNNDGTIDIVPVQVDMGIMYQHTLQQLVNNGFLDIKE